MSISKSLIVDNLMRMDLILAGRTSSTGHVMLSVQPHIAYLANTHMVIAVKVCNRLPSFHLVLMLLVAADGTDAVFKGMHSPKPLTALGAGSGMVTAGRIIIKHIVFCVVGMGPVPAAGAGTVLQNMPLLIIESAVRTSPLVEALIQAGIGKGMFMFLVVADGTGIAIHLMVLMYH